jgi:adenylylsulfate kinase
MTNIVPFEQQVTTSMRLEKQKIKPFVLWFTGLSASGKSTLASMVEFELFSTFKGSTFLLDGDTLRSGICNDLDFSSAGRTENIRRVSELSGLFLSAGLIVVTAFISPFIKDRDAARALFTKGDFIEIFVDCPLAVCQNRDPKGLYKLAEEGKILDFTGIDSPYEQPKNAELSIDTFNLSPREGVDKIIEYLVENNYLR